MLEQVSLFVSQGDSTCLFKITLSFVGRSDCIDKFVTFKCRFMLQTLQGKDCSLTSDSDIPVYLAAVKVVLEVSGQLLDSKSAHETLVGCLSLVNLALLNLQNALVRLGCKLRGLCDHSRGVARVRILCELVGSKGLALWRGLEPQK